MRETDYRELRSRLVEQGVFQLSDLRGALTFLGELVVHLAALAWLWVIPPFSVGYWLLQLFLGLSCFRFFVIVHETGHGSLFRTSRLNTLVGSLASIFCLVPYIPWRNIHLLHHKWVGVIDKDPTQAALLDLKNFSAGKNMLFRFVWFFWIPAMFTVFIFQVFWGYPFAQFAKGNRKDAWPGLASVLVCLAPRVALVAWLGWERFAVLFVPMLVVFFFIDENVSLPQHTGLFPFLSDTHPKPIPFWEQDGVTRTTNKPGWVSVLLAYNFNLHVEHHLFPMAPWYRLPAIATHLAQAPEYQQVNFVKYMMDLRTKDPVDIYTRALPSPATTFEGEAPPTTSPQT